MGLGGILIVVGLLGLWEGFDSYYSGKPLPGQRRWQNPAAGERVGGLLIMVFGAVSVVAGIVLVLVDLLA